MTTCVWVLVYVMSGVTYRSARWQPAVIKMLLWTVQLPMHPIMTPTLILLNGLVNTSNETSKQMAKRLSVPALQTVSATWHTSTERKQGMFYFYALGNMELVSLGQSFCPNGILRRVHARFEMIMCGFLCAASP